MLTGPYAFLEMPSSCGLQPCARTHLKKALCHKCPFGGASIKYRCIPTLHLSSCWVALRLAMFTAGRIWPSLSRPLELSLASGAFSPGFYPLRAGGGYCPAPVVPLLRYMLMGLKAFLAMRDLLPCARTHQKRPCTALNRSVGWVTNTAVS